MADAMKQFSEFAADGTPYQDTLTLPFRLREKSRLRARLDGGQEVALILPRGGVLRGGGLLRADDGAVIRVEAALEGVSVVRGADATALARAAYHLGNRHVAVQVGDGFLRYQHDHVLDDMVRGLGLRVSFERAAFEPEAGAYAHGHGHEGEREFEHEHEHEHERDHDHDHDHERDQNHGREGEGE